MSLLASAAAGHRTQIRSESTFGTVWMQKPMMPSGAAFATSSQAVRTQTCRGRICGHQHSTRAGLYDSREHRSYGTAKARPVCRYGRRRVRQSFYGATIDCQSSIKDIRFVGLSLFSVRPPSVLRPMLRC